MNKKIVSILIIALCATFAIFPILSFAIVDRREIPHYQTDNDATIETVRMQKITEGFMGALKGNKTINIHLSREELNTIAKLYMSDKLSKVRGKLTISDFVIIPEKSGINLEIQVKLLDFIPSVVRVEVMPELVDNKLSFVITSATIGKMKIPKNQLVDILRELESEKLEVDEKDNKIIVHTQLPKQFILQSISSDSTGINMEFSLNIHSASDVLDIIGVSLPDDLRTTLGKVELKDVPEQINKYLTGIDSCDINKIMQNVSEKTADDYVNALKSYTGNVVNAVSGSLKSDISKASEVLSKHSEQKDGSNANKNLKNENDVNAEKAGEIIYNSVKDAVKEQPIIKKAEIVDKILTAKKKVNEKQK